jgi:hypothetical protein
MRLARGRQMMRRRVPGRMDDWKGAVCNVSANGSIGRMQRRRRPGEMNCKIHFCSSYVHNDLTVISKQAARTRSEDK